MRKNCLLLVICFFLCSSFHIVKNNKLTVEVLGFSDNQGVVYVALYRETDSFPIMDAQYQGKTTGISNKSAKVQFSGLSNEKYAVAVFHDRNKNGEMDKNLLGIPTESYGFSNNAREMFSAPSFKSASFSIKSETTIKIKIH